MTTIQPIRSISRQRGVSALLIVGSLLIVAGLTGIGFVWMQPGSHPPGVATAESANRAAAPMPEVAQQASPEKSPMAITKTKPVLVAGQDLPALPFIERDKEIDYFKGEWRLKKTFPLYAKEGDRVPIKTLPARTKLDGLSLATHTLSYEVVEIGKPRTIKVWDFLPQGQRKSFNIRLQRGDKIAVLSYFGEGECRTWIKGRVYIAECLQADADPAVNSLPAADRFSGKTETTRWALVRTRDGLKGWLWLKDPDIEDIQGISKHGESVTE